MLNFEPCECGRHGRFNTSYTETKRAGNGSVVETVVSGHEVATKDDAKAFVQTAFARGVIDQAADSSLIVQIERTAMSQDDASADPIVLTAARDWNLQLAVVRNAKAFLAARPKGCLVRASVA